MISSLRLKQRSSGGRPTSFRSYVDLNLPENDSTAGTKNEEESEDQSYIQLTPTLLGGEVVIASADNVLKFNTFSELKTGISGALFCTNFKLCFVTAHQNPYSLQHQNLLLGENDICLLNIDSVHQVCSGRRKKLMSGSNVASSVEIIEIHCKDFRVFTFSFKFSLPNQDKALINAILHHAFAPKIQLLFAFEYDGEIDMPDHMTFTKPTQWLAELKRTGCSGWRVTQANEKFLLCDSFPETFVVPAKLMDADLARAVPSFVSHRALAWSWGVESGQALVRMGSIDPSIEDDQQRISIIEAVAGANPEGQAPQVIDLNVECPSVKEIQASFMKLKELCMPASSSEFWEQDSHYYSSLENTRWLHCVSALLKVALQGAEIIEHQRSSLILEESENRDLNAAASSLVQIILEPRCRTQKGFEQLVEKEWIALGHPFTLRLAHLRDMEQDESPVFLLFLDCVWQLLIQFPCAFEFSETYLTTLWDTTHVSIFGTFLFASHKQRSDVGRSFCSAWKWSLQYTYQDMLLFRNPLYILGSHHNEFDLNSVRPQSMGPNNRHVQVSSFSKPVHLARRDDILLNCDPSVVALELWSQCYLRWVPLANIVGGGRPVLYLQNFLAAEDIKFLSGTLKVLTQQRLQQNILRHKRSASDDFCVTVEGDARRIPQNTSLVTSAFPFSPVGPTEWQKFNVPSSSCLCVSYGTPEEDEDE